MNIKTLVTISMSVAFATVALADLELGDAKKLPPAAKTAGVTYDKDISRFSKSRA
jgi:hypothetical protein